MARTIIQRVDKNVESPVRKMTMRGVDFRQAWIATNITDGDRPGSRELATILADRCRAEAASKGIGLAELETDFVTIEMAIYEAMTAPRD